MLCVCCGCPAFQAEHVAHFFSALQGKQVDTVQELDDKAFDRPASLNCNSLRMVLHDFTRFAAVPCIMAAGGCRLAEQKAANEAPRGFDLPGTEWSLTSHVTRPSEPEARLGGGLRNSRHRLLHGAAAHHV